MGLLKHAADSQHACLRFGSSARGPRRPQSAGLPSPRDQPSRRRPEQLWPGKEGGGRLSPSGFARPLGHIARGCVPPPSLAPLPRTVMGAQPRPGVTARPRGPLPVRVWPRGKPPPGGGRAGTGDGKTALYPLRPPPQPAAVPPDGGSTGRGSSQTPPGGCLALQTPPRGTDALSGSPFLPCESLGNAGAADGSGRHKRAVWAARALSDTLAPRPVPACPRRHAAVTLGRCLRRCCDCLAAGDFGGGCNGGSCRNSLCHGTEQLKAMKVNNVPTTHSVLRVGKCLRCS